MPRFLDLVALQVEVPLRNIANREHSEVVKPDSVTNEVDVMASDAYEAKSSIVVVSVGVRRKRRAVTRPPAADFTKFRRSVRDSMRCAPKSGLG